TAASATNASNATNATNAVSADNATTLGGFDDDATDAGNTIARRNSSGDLFVRYINSSAAPSGSLSVGHIFVMTGADGYTRPCTIDRVGIYMEARNISSRTGTQKTLSTSTPSGGSNGDIWYRY